MYRFLLFSVIHKKSLKILLDLCIMGYSWWTSFSSWSTILIRRVWEYQRGNQNPYIEEEQTTQWQKENVQKDKQRSTKHTYKTKDRVTRTPLKTGGELRCWGRIGSSCSTSDTRRVNLVTNPVISHAWGKGHLVFTELLMNALVSLQGLYLVLFI